MAPDRWSVLPSVVPCYSGNRPANAPLESCSYRGAFPTINQVAGVTWETALSLPPDELAKTLESSIQETRANNEAIKPSVAQNETVPGAGAVAWIAPPGSVMTSQQAAPEPVLTRARAGVSPRPGNIQRHR